MSNFIFLFVISVSSGLLLAWEQWTQTAITTGDTRVLRFWDTEKEMKSFDIPTGADCSVTCLDSTYASVSHENQILRSMKDSGSEDEGLYFGGEYSSYESRQKMGLVIAGFADGTVRVYDRRCNPNDARVKLWMEHSSPLFGVLLRGDKIVTGSSSGGVRIYDMRTNDLYHANTAVYHMTSFAMHRNAETYAW